MTQELSSPDIDQLPTPKKRPPRFQTLAGIAGNILEWYDFAVFGFFADILSEVFFPPQTGNRALVESFVIFGAAFLMRPVGGIIMGWIGDKYGRKRALEISIFLMAIPTFALGCLPTYNQVGYWSIILLSLVRLLQGLSVGGQLVSSLVFILEQHDDEKHRWGLLGSYVMAAANFGTLTGGVVASTIRAIFSPEDLLSYGWRIPFLSGIVVSICGIYLKWACVDEFTANHPEPPQNPLKMALRSKRSLLASCLVPMVWAAGVYVCFVWMPVFMSDFSEPPVPNPFLVNSLALLISVCLFFPCAGMISDKYGRVLVMKIACATFGISAPFLLYLISKGNPYVALLSQCLLGFSLSLFGAPMTAWLVESFAPDARLTSVAIGYNVANAVAGGLTPSIATIIVGLWILSPGFLLTGISLLSLIGLICVAPPGQDFTSPTDQDEIQDLEFTVEDDKKLKRKKQHSKERFAGF